MAAKARARQAKAKQPKRPSHPQSSVATKVIRRARWMRVALRRLLFPLDAPARLIREAVALLLLVATVLLWAGLLGIHAVGGAIIWVVDGLRLLCGQGAWVVPGLGVWLAGELLLNQHGAAVRRRGLGLTLYLLALLVIFDRQPSTDPRTAGGYLGAALGALLRLFGGPLGAEMLALVLGAIGLAFFTGHALLTSLAWLHGLFVRSALVNQVKTPKTSPEQFKPNRDGERQTPLTDVQPVISLPETGRSRGRKSARTQSPVSSAESTHDVASLPLPDLSRLQLYAYGVPDPSELQRKAAIIQETLTSFRVDARVREIFPGPAVTLFTLEPGPGVKVRRITELQNDLALALAAPSIRIEAPVPGMARVGIEVPNAKIHTVGLRETMESAAFQESAAKLPLALGRDVHGQYVVADLTKMPHLLIAGATGSGKSVCINSIIATFLLTKRPDELQMLLIDPKMVELTGFEGVPHLKRPVVTDMALVVGALRRVLQEMERRYQLFAQLGVRNLEGYQLRREEDPSLEPLPYFVVIIDELADLMLTTPDEVETLLVRLAQMARATGIHLLIATQRPSVDVLTGLIKANVPARIAFAVTSQTDSRVILDMPGAERLLGRGDMLFLAPDAARPQRIQGSFIEDRDLNYLVEHWRSLVPEPRYDPLWLNLDADAQDDNREDPLLDQARQLVLQHGSASTSMLQRRLRIGYNRAARLMEQLEAEGLVGPSDGPRGRQVYLQHLEE